MLSDDARCVISCNLPHTSLTATSPPPSPSLAEIISPPPSLCFLLSRHARVLCISSANVGTSGGFPVYDDAATFYTALSDFTAEGVNARFLTDIVFNDDGTIKVNIYVGGADAVGFGGGAIHPRKQEAGSNAAAVRGSTTVLQTIDHCSSKHSCAMTVAPLPTLLTPTSPS